MLTALAAALILFLFDPATDALFPPCPFNTITGYYCPGCGSLRALHELSHGHLLKALGYNALTVLSLPFIAYGLALQMHWYVTGRSLTERRLPARLITALFWGILAFWLLRNLPYYPFTLLAPGG